MDNLPALTDRAPQAEARVSLGERHIANQRGIIARLDLRAFSTEDFLELFQELHINHVAGRDRLKSEIEKNRAETVEVG